MRFASRDIIFGIAVVRHSRRDNLLEVDVCLTTDPPQYPEHSGASLTMLNLFSDAFKCGGSMEVRFTRNVWRGIPPPITAYAHSLGVQLAHTHQGVITPKEAGEFYLELTGFSEAAKRRILELSDAGLLSSNRVCYMVHHGIWTLPEIEHILLAAPYPERVLLGSSLPEQGILWTHDVLVARNALLGAYLDRKLHKKVTLTENGAVELEGDENWVKISFSREEQAKTYVHHEPLVIPWTDGSPLLPAGSRLDVLVRARNANEIQIFAQNDLTALAKMGQNREGPHAILVARDFTETPAEFQHQFRAALRSLGVPLLICPVFVDSLDSDARQRLDRTRRNVRDDRTAQQVHQAKTARVSRPSGCQISLIRLPSSASLRYGNLEIPKTLGWLTHLQSMIATGSNLDRGRARLSRVLERLQFASLGLHLDGDSTGQRNFGVELMDLVVRTVHSNPALAWQISNGAWDGGTLEQKTNQIARLLSQLGFDNLALSQWLSFLTSAASRHSSVIQTLDIFQPSANIAVKSDAALIGSFRSRPVRDTITDNRGLSTLEASIRTASGVASDISRGLPGSLNFSDMRDAITAETLYALAHSPDFGPSGIMVPIIYADGSRAADFPIGCLRPRQENELAILQDEWIWRIGMISGRHPELDWLVNFYWLNNILISRPVTAAETDDLTYRLSREQFEKRRSRPWRFRFYLTGLEPALVGFLRALTEELVLGQGQPTRIEMLPRYFDPAQRLLREARITKVEPTSTIKPDHGRPKIDYVCGNPWS